MILALSSSSAMTSVALIDSNGGILFSATREWKNRALEAFSEMLSELPVSLSEVDLFVADLGPGSFTGTRVGVTLTKSLAYAQSKPCSGCDSFDLIAANRTVVFPSKRGEWFVRVPGEAVFRTEEPLDVLKQRYSDLVGFGLGFEDFAYPSAEKVAEIRGRLVPSSPAELLPIYLIEPSISTPKKPIGYTMSNPNVAPSSNSDNG